MINIILWSCYVYQATPFSAVFISWKFAMQKGESKCFFLLQGTIHWKNFYRVCACACPCAVLESANKKIPIKVFVNTIRLLVLVFCAIANSSASRKRFLIENSPLTVIKYSTSATTKGLTMKRVVLKSHQCCYMTITVHYDTNASIINSSRFQTLSELGKENPN